VIQQGNVPHECTWMAIQKYKRSVVELRANLLIYNAFAVQQKTEALKTSSRVASLLHATIKILAHEQSRLWEESAVALKTLSKSSRSRSPDTTYNTASKKVDSPSSPTQITTIDDDDEIAEDSTNLEIQRETEELNKVIFPTLNQSASIAYRGRLDFCISPPSLQKKLASSRNSFASLPPMEWKSVDVIITTQNWAQFAQTWNFQDLNSNPVPPFITTVRQPEVKYGSNPSLTYTIPNRRQFYWAKVPTWDGNRKGMDVYKIPQPVPVDITYQVKIVCNRMRELNQFNRIVLQKFSSRQAYTFVKGSYIPIVLQNISDDSSMDVDKRKYYVQTYEFLMMGFLIDEEEFEVKPAVSRLLQLIEVDTKTRARKAKMSPVSNSTNVDFQFGTGDTEVTQTFNYTANVFVSGKDNVDTWSVYINNDYYGDDVTEIQINTHDVLRIEITKDTAGQTATLFTTATLL